MSVLRKRRSENGSVPSKKVKDSEFTRLSDEMVERIFFLCDAESLMFLRTLCRRFYSIILSRRLWEKFPLPQNAPRLSKFHTQSMAWDFMYYRQENHPLLPLFSYWKQMRGSRALHSPPRIMNTLSLPTEIALDWPPSFDINEELVILSNDTGRIVFHHGNEFLPTYTRLSRGFAQVCLASRNRVWEYVDRDIKYEYALYDIERIGDTPVIEFSFEDLVRSFVSDHLYDIAYFSTYHDFWRFDPRIGKMDSIIPQPPNLSVAFHSAKEISLEGHLLLNSNRSEVSLYDLRFSGRTASPIWTVDLENTHIRKCLMRNDVAVCVGKKKFFAMYDLNNPREHDVYNVSGKKIYGGCIVDHNFLFLSDGKSVLFDITQPEEQRYKYRATKCLLTSFNLDNPSETTDYEPPNCYLDQCDATSMSIKSCGYRVVMVNGHETYSAQLLDFAA